MLRWYLAFVFLIVLAGCSTRGLNDRYASVTEQRLVTQSLDQLIRQLPQTDFEPLRQQPVYLQAYFIEPQLVESGKQASLLDFAQQRLKLELREKYSSRLVADPEAANFELHFFFNAIGTDQDGLGISSPQLFLPGVGISQIDFITLEMFHGVCEGYYYIVDRQLDQTSRSELQKARVRTDRLNLPFIAIPLNTLD